MIANIAVVNSNTLAAIGLKNILQSFMPMMEVDILGSFSELEANIHKQYYHYFVSLDIMLRNRPFFMAHRQKTIILTTSTESSPAGFNSICVNVPEPQLIKSLLSLEHSAHAHGKNLPPQSMPPKILSDREVEVMALIVSGLINKEIAARLNISIATVITHRKNIMDKLGIKSVSALTVYAVMHGYVDISAI